MLLQLLIKHTTFKNKIIKQLYFGKQLSCSDLSIAANKSLPVVTKTLSELIAEGSVQETGYATSTGGRRPQMYSLPQDLMYTVSVAMDQLVTRIAMVNMDNQLEGEVFKFNLELSRNDQALQQLTEKIEFFIAESDIPKSKIAGVGIGMPGFVDIGKGINHSFLKCPTGNIAEHISAVVDLPVFIDNDSSLVALAELRFGAAAGIQNAMVINIGWGVGLGMILNGKIFRGYNGFAGEFSHIPLFTNGKMCSCGKIGCLETETSLLVIVDKAIEGIREGKMTVLKDITTTHPQKAVNAIIAAAASGDNFAIQLFSEVAYNIGRGVAILIHLLNPELIVLSGLGADAGKVWLAPIQQAINEHCIPKILENTELQLSSLGKNAEIIGAAALVMENFDRLHRPEETLSANIK